MRRASRVIVVHDNKLLIMHRNKFGNEYDTLPGGAVNISEGLDQAALRELAEETSVQVKNPRLVFIEHSEPMYGDQYIFLCEYVSGEPQLHEDSEEASINKLGQNIHEPRWMPLDQLPASNFLSAELKEALLEGFKNGWPAEGHVKEFHGKRNV